MGMRTLNTKKHNVYVVISKGVFGKETFIASDKKVEINVNVVKELVEKKEFRRAKVLCLSLRMMRAGLKELDRRMEEKFTKIGALTASMHRQLDHVMTFLLSQIGTNGSLDGQQRLVVKGRYAPKNFEGTLRRCISPQSQTPSKLARLAPP
ncbi:eukaryotic translation initiation factor 2 subunit beta [Tanacetum coccineum]